MFEGKTTAEIAAVIDSDTKLKELAKWVSEVLKLFRSLSPERQLIVVKTLEKNTRM